MLTGTFVRRFTPT